MRKRKIKAIYITDKQLSIIELNDELNEYYELLNCECIDIITRQLNNRFYDFIIDDEGALKDNYISALWLDENKQPIECINGALIITRADETKGTQESLREKDIINIFKSIIKITSDYEITNNYTDTTSTLKKGQEVLLYGENVEN